MSHLISRCFIWYEVILDQYETIVTGPLEKMVSRNNALELTELPSINEVGSGQVLSVVIRTNKRSSLMDRKRKWCRADRAVWYKQVGLVEISPVVTLP